MTDEHRERDDRLLADDLSMSLEHLYEVAGLGWQLLGDGQVLDESFQQRRWYVAGEPAQVMLGVLGDKEPLLVGRPQVKWESHRAVLQPQAPEVVNSFDDLAVVLRRVCLARHRTFRWCRYCRTLVAPEERTEPDVCMGCATTVQGIVF